jgi:hypothetical protein
MVLAKLCSKFDKKGKKTFINHLNSLHILPLVPIYIGRVDEEGWK